ncbi:hypothetical protein [Paenibacillus sp. 32352]|uniref:hypothetical protein n=1 Tax=Paenibacillus sp. 32352 TaxID=1969111 RepID=UPI0009AE665E|nr:hypothetical protein [Paenibacillus sp. 32352]
MLIHQILCKPIKTLFSRQFYYTFVEAWILLLIIVLGIIKSNSLYIRITLLSILIVYYIPFIFYVIDINRQKKQRIVENRGTGGYLRWDGIYEVHIGDVVSPRDFHQRLIKALLYCKERKLLAEFITANRSHESLLKQLGPSVIKITHLGLYSKIILRFGSKKNTVVNASNRPIKVLLDPSTLSFRKLKTGESVLMLNKLDVPNN